VAKKKRLFSQAEVEDQLVAGLYHVVDEADWPQLRLLGFDSSTKTLGGVLLDAGTGRLLAYFGFDWHSYYLADRIGMQQAMLERLLPHLTIGALWIGVGVELPASGDFRGAGALVVGGPLTVMGAARRSGLDLFEYNPTNLKVAMTGNPSADKAAMMQFATLTAGVAFTDNNTADGYAAALCLLADYRLAGGDVQKLRAIRIAR